MSKSQINKFFKEVNVPYVIYGNFNFVSGENEDVDVLIQQCNFSQVKYYLTKNNLAFHERKYYPGQLFITGTEIKIHVTSDLFIGGRRVAYLLRLLMIDKLILNSITWNNYQIINFKDYVKYRKIKTFFNANKEMKTTEYPSEFRCDMKAFVRTRELFIFSLKVIIINSVFIIPRFLKKRVWVKL